MPRTSAAAASSPLIPGKRRPAPPELDAREAKIWTEIARRLPDNWFTTDNAPLLKELCRHIRHADDLATDLALARAAVNEIRATPQRDPVGKLLAEAKKELYSLMRLHGYQSERIGNLATKLRLTNQARYEPSRARAEAAKTASSYPEPWSDWGLDAEPSPDPGSDEQNGQNRKQ
jgi:hypothetical protein